MSATTKLSKKQKKGLAFRQRKAGKPKQRDGRGSVEDNDIPVMEDQDALDREGSDMEGKAGVRKKQSAVKIVDDKSKTEGEKKAEGESQQKKRKRTATLDAEEGTQPAKRKRNLDDDEESGDKDITKPKQRFILFVGNLKYTTSLEAINAHFAGCDPPPTVRLLTPKASSAGKPTQKSKGCAFLEFTHRNALQQALKLHQSTLDGRMINVELTAGGGGKSESRLAKVKARNKELLGQRKERLEKITSDGKTIPTMPERPQRFSATSGVEQIPTNRRTWTVGGVDDEETHRGGKRHTQRSKSRSKAKVCGTGVNAIPIG